MPALMTPVAEAWYLYPLLTEMVRIVSPVVLTIRAAGIPKRQQGIHTQSVPAWRRHVP